MIPLILGIVLLVIFAFVAVKQVVVPSSSVGQCYGRRPPGATRRHDRSEYLKLRGRLKPERVETRASGRGRPAVAA